MKKKLFITLTAVLLGAGLLAQEYKKLTLEDLYKNRIFHVNSVYGMRWMNDGSFYTSMEFDRKTNSVDIVKYDTKQGVAVDTIVYGNRLIPTGSEKPISIDDYQFDNNEQKLLLATDKKSIYRRSTIANYYVYEISSKKLIPVDEGGKQSYATFSPDGSMVGFVRDNNIFIKDLNANKLVQVTTDGKKNEIINGFADWVYEEELSLTRAFFWSPDGQKIAYLKFDESEVPMYNMQIWKGLYPEDYRYKYPKAGEKNSVVTIHIYDLPSGKTSQISVGDETDVYIARLQWLPTGNMISVTRLNRLQNQRDIFHCDAKTGKCQLAYSEKTDTYVDLDRVDDLTYLNDGKSFIISSEKSGFKHLYHYENNGKLIAQITRGNWMVDNFIGIDEKKGLLYFTSTMDSPIERQLYVTDLKGKKLKKLSDLPGVHSVTFSRDFKYYIDNHSSAFLPPSTILYSAKGKMLNVLAENSEYEKQTKEYGFAKTEFFSVPISSGDSLNAYIMLPVDFDENKKYPMLMYVYGGPGSQSVMNRWNRNSWHHFLTQQGYIVVGIDNRGTGGRGRAFQDVTYKQLGKIESEDIIASAKYLVKYPFIDENRIGIWGWSYGGYMSSLCLMVGNDIFKAAIAVAPVTNWRFYDTIYTERYLQKPQDNPSGYDDYSPVNHAGELEGAFLLIHGTGDDNVHFQNTIELQNALIKANKQFRSFFYPNRNHGIYGGNTTLHLYTMMTEFILENL